MQKYVSIHPVIYKIDRVWNNDYLIFETLKLGFLPYSFTYPATVIGEKRKMVVTMNATVMKINKIEMIFRIQNTNEGCSVEETINFKSPLPIKSMMGEIFKKQHAQLFKNIEQAE